MNAYEKTLPEVVRLPTVTLADAMAGNAFIGSIFGNGGGGEISNSELLGRLKEKYAELEAEKIYQDLRSPTSRSSHHRQVGVPVRQGTGSG